MHPALDPKSNPEFAKVQQEVLGDVFTVKSSSPIAEEGSPSTINELEIIEKSVDESKEMPSSNPTETMPPDEPDHYDGYKTFEQYVQDGGDPDFYRGKEAYKQQKELIREKKDSENKLKSRLDAMEQQLINLAVSNEQQKKSEIAELRAAIEEARKDGDAVALDEAYQKLNNASQPVQPNQARGPMPSIQEFISNDQRLDRTAPGYDNNYYIQFDALLTANINEATNRAGRPLTDPEVKMHLDNVNTILNSSNQQNTQTLNNPNRARASKVAAPGAKSPKGDPTAKMDLSVKGLYDRWTNSRDPRDKEMAKVLRKKYEG